MSETLKKTRTIGSKTQIVEVEKVVEKIVEKIITVQITTNINGASSFNIGYNGRNCIFNLMGSPTGCGLGILYGWTGLPHIDDAAMKIIRAIIKQRCIPHSWHGLIATLGDSGKMYEPVLLKMGFKRVSEFNNKNHGDNYKQGIYMVETKDIPD